MNSKNSVCWWLKEKHLCLASASPRRLALLKQVGLDPEVRAMNLDETQKPFEAIDVYCERMALSKAQGGSVMQADLVIGADTVVIVANELLGKPANAQEARNMLVRLSGQKHSVLTAVAVFHPATNRCISQLVETQVWLKTLSTEEIYAYVATGEPLDKAGAYGIQGVGAFMVTRMEGSYSGVVGLPLYETLAMLREFA